ncbi:MAG: 2-oxo-4-hydroxy-4-carboxy-5-ureidoimidazoline decarboxylase, partial [Candidatus Puniceispirillales bacterium]
RPGRIESLRRFIEYIKTYDHVWCPRRIDIANHWHQHHPFDMDKARTRPSLMAKDQFVSQFGGVFEHSKWIAEAAFDLELGPAHDTPTGLHHALCRIFRSSGADKQLKVLKAHPDLAGKLAMAKKLTAHSTDEQASAGLDALTDDERARFTELNTTYQDRFGFPFIIAVKGLNKADILSAFERRIAHDRDTEFAEACRQVERIALIRVKALF